MAAAPLGSGRALDGCHLHPTGAHEIRLSTSETTLSLGRAWVMDGVDPFNRKPLFPTSLKCQCVVSDVGGVLLTTHHSSSSTYLISPTVLGMTYLHTWRDVCMAFTNGLFLIPPHKVAHKNDDEK